MPFGSLLRQLLHLRGCSYTQYTHSIHTGNAQFMCIASPLEYFRKINKNQNISWGWPVQTTKVAILDLGPYPAYQKKQPLYRSLCISIYTMNKFINNLLTHKVSHSMGIPILTICYGYMCIRTGFSTIAKTFHF